MTTATERERIFGARPTRAAKGAVSGWTLYPPRSPLVRALASAPRSDHQPGGRSSSGRTRRNIATALSSLVLISSAVQRNAGLTPFRCGAARKKWIDFPIVKEEWLLD